MSDDMLPIGDFSVNFDPNPMVRLHGRGPEGKACRSCRHMVTHTPTGNRTYWKCYRRGITNGAGTDHRLKWNACRLWEN